MVKTLNIRHVAIIGGGVAGLAAAAELTRHNIKVTLFEASQSLGGRTRSFEYKGSRLDNGQHILLGAYHETLRLLAQAGVKESNVLLRLPLQMIIQDLINKNLFKLKAYNHLPAPLHLIIGLMFAWGLNITEKFAAIYLMIFVKLISFKIQQDLPLINFLESKKQPHTLINKLWEPLCLAALNTPINQASTQIFLNVLHDSFNGKKSDSDMLLPKVDLSTMLVEPLETYITDNGGKIKINTTVKNILQNNDKFTVEANSVTEHFTHVIIAVGPHQLKNLKLNNVSIAQPTKHFNYQPITTIYLQYPADVRLNTPMSGLSNATCQWLFDRGRLCEQQGLIAVVISANGQHQVMTNEELIEKAIAEIQQIYPDISSPIWTKVICEKRATFSCDSSLKRFENRAKIAKLFLIGDYTTDKYPSTIEGAIISGVNVTNSILMES